MDMGMKDKTDSSCPLFYRRKNHMWNFFTHFMAFGFGMTMGVVLMCLLQAGKMADEEMAMLLEKKKQEEKGE